MVRKYEPTVRTIIVAVIHIPILRRVLLEISVVRRDLCHFCQSSPRRVLGVAIRANPRQQQTRPTIGDANQSLRLAHPDRRFRQSAPLPRVRKSERTCDPQPSTAANSVAGLTKR